jgi:hypothetical protein
MTSISDRISWRTPAVVSVFVLSMVSNVDTAHRYLSRMERGWLLWAMCVAAGLLPLLCGLPSRWLSRLWKGLSIASILLVVVAWWRIPVETVRVDRWELMSNFLLRLFQGDYPYLASSRYNVAPPAPFPWLFLVGIPAWLAGEIGWFPLASLALLVWTAPRRVRPFLVVALATSLPVWYEVIVRSNIVANAALVGAFLLTKPGRDGAELARSGVLAGVVMCTRASFVAPVLAWAGSVFLADRQWKRFAIWGTVATFVALLPFALLIASWGWPVFRDWNPLRIQGSIQSPVGPFLLLAASPWIGSMAKSAIDRLWTAYAVALFPMLALLLPVLADGSWVLPNRGYFEVAFWNTSLVLGLLAWAVGGTDLERGS